MDRDPTYTVEVCNSYTGHDQLRRCLTAKGLGFLVEELTGIEAATITADVEADGTYRHTCSESGLEISIHPTSAVPA